MRADLATILRRPIAHRGLHEASRGVIENSMAAARAAIAAGFGIECDVQLSADGEAVVFHDTTLDRLTLSSGPVSTRPAAELAGIALKNGQGDCLPTLEEFLGLIAGRVPVIVEIKSADANSLDRRLAARAVAVAAGYRGPVALKSFDPGVMAHCNALGARCPLGLVGPAESSHPAAAPAAFDIAPYDFLSWNIAALRELRAIHPGIPLMTWTVRSGEQQSVASRFGAQIVFEAFCPATSEF